MTDLKFFREWTPHPDAWRTLENGVELLEAPACFWVQGTPQPQPRVRKDGRSGRWYADKTKAGRDIGPWKARIVIVARQAMAQLRLERIPLGTAVWVQIDLSLPRPQDHYVSRNRKRPLRVDAPRLKPTKPDRDNYEKAITDALSGVLWHDDGVVVSGPVTKWYERPDWGLGARLLFARCR